MSKEIPSGLAKGLIGKEIACCGVLRGHDSSVLCVTFDPEGQTVCSGSEDGELRLWRVVNGQWQVRDLARPQASFSQPRIPCMGFPVHFPIHCTAPRSSAEGNLSSDFLSAKKYHSPRSFPNHNVIQVETYVPRQWHSDARLTQF